MRRRKILSVVFWTAAGLAALALLVAVTGGFQIRLAGVRVRSHSWSRPALLSAVLALLYVVAERRTIAANLSASWTVFDSAKIARALTLSAAAWAVGAGVKFGTFVAGGSDSYGYVSQARLLASGRVTDTVPLDAAFTWPNVAATLTPLAFVPTTTPDVIAPMYPPGLPLLMAAVSWISRDAIFLVVPLLGALAVWLCYRLGAALGDPLAGSIAAALFALSPTFLFQLVQPMSDVPAAACWLAALLLASRGSPASAVAAGAATSLAILIRPNLAPLALAIAVVAAIRARAASAFFVVIGMIPGLIALGWIQHVRYGSFLRFGYGEAGTFLAVSSVMPNLQRYPRWLTETHTWFIWLWVLAPFVALRRGSGQALRARTARAIGFAAVAIILGTFTAYLPYSYFQMHEWHYSRYMLPAIPLMLLLGSMVALIWIRRAPLAWRLPLTLVLLCGLGVTFIRVAAARDVFRFQRHEQRYRAAGEYVRTKLPPEAFVLAAQHSGSVRFYGERPILRWDLLEPTALDQAVATLRRTGHVPFLVVEPFEHDEFRTKFSAAGQQAAERARLIGLVEEVRVYAFE